MSEQATETAKRPKGRSPAYPAIDLGLALERANALWDAEHLHRTPIPTVLGHWGYGPKSGGGFAVLAALKQFGLVDDEGRGEDRKAWLTEFAQDLLVADNDEKRQAAIQTAALKPPIHAQLWKRYQKNLPSDPNLHLILLREFSFTDSGAQELISEWKRTMKFAGLTTGLATVPEERGDTTRDQGEPKVTPPATIEREKPQYEREQERQTVKRQSTSRTVQVPYSPDKWALVEASFPMSEREWDSMLAVLQAMKLGLVAPPDES